MEQLLQIEHAGLVASCDIAVASERAQFGVSEVRVSIIPATIGPYVPPPRGQHQRTGKAGSTAFARR